MVSFAASTHAQWGISAHAQTKSAIDMVADTGSESGAAMGSDQAAVAGNK